MTRSSSNEQVPLLSASYLSKISRCFLSLKSAIRPNEFPMAAPSATTQSQQARKPQHSNNVNASPFGTVKNR